VRDTTYDESTFERLRAAARAADELDAEERERIATGAVEAEWERVEKRLTELRDALDAYPER